MKLTPEESFEISQILLENKSILEAVREMLKSKSFSEEDSTGKEINKMVSIFVDRLENTTNVLEKVSRPRMS